MSTLLQIAQLGHPILRTVASPVTDVNDPAISLLIDDLIATVMDANGVGISAPQVYRPLRLFILASHPNPRYPNAPDMKPTAVINPRIVSHQRKKETDWEGCLSIPGIRGLVPRFHSIQVEYTSRHGRRVTAAYTGFVARIFQHEFDHLKGITFLERVATTKDLVSEKEYQKLIQNSVPKEYAHQKIITSTSKTIS